MALPPSQLCARSGLRAQVHRVHRVATLRSPRAPRKSAGRRPSEIAAGGCVAMCRLVQFLNVTSGGVRMRWTTLLLCTFHGLCSLLSSEIGRITLVSNSARQSVDTLASQCARKSEDCDTKKDHRRSPRLRAALRHPLKMKDWRRRAARDAIRTPALDSSSSHVNGICRVL